MNKPGTPTIIISHLLVWIAMLGIPAMFMLGGAQPFRWRALIEHSWINTAFYAVVFYVNYFYFIKKFFFNNKKILFVIINIAALFMCSFLMSTVRHYIFHPNLGLPMFNSYMFYFNAISLLMPLFIALAMRTYSRLLSMEQIQRDNDNKRLMSELQHLKYQLQPHFFFNSLNNIYSLVDRSPEKAKETLISLSKLMRYLLYETNSERVEFSKEIDFMSKYIDLMKLRTAAHTEVEVNFPSSTNGITVAPLMFISLIENSFKHGILPQGKSQLIFNISIEGTRITFTSKNPYVKQESADLTEKASIGIENLSKQLLLLYPNKHEFKTYIENDCYHAYLSIETV